MKTKKILSFLTMFIFTFSLTFAGPKHLSNSEKWVPKDFDPKKIVLLIVRFPSSVNKKGISRFSGEEARIVKFLKENYPYAYEIIDNPSDAKYIDTQKYPYALSFDQRMNDKVPAFSNSPNASAATSVTKYYCMIYDRKQRKYIDGPLQHTDYPADIMNQTVYTMLYTYDERNKK